MDSGPPGPWPLCFAWREGPFRPVPGHPQIPGWERGAQPRWVVRDSFVGSEGGGSEARRAQTPGGALPLLSLGVLVLRCSPWTRAPDCFGLKSTQKAFDRTPLTEGFGSCWQGRISSLFSAGVSEARAEMMLMSGGKSQQQRVQPPGGRWTRGELHRWAAPQTSVLRHHTSERQSH